MDYILIGGLWLTPEVWDQVVAELTQRGLRANAVALPGQGDGNVDATLEDQVQAVLAAVRAADKPYVVGHSAACTLAWMVADRGPQDVAGVALIGGCPSSDGETYAEFFPLRDGQMAFPGWEPFAGADSDDLTAEGKAAIEQAAVPVPGGVASAVVHYSDERRHDVPVALICPEFTPQDALEWIEGGDAPELADATQVSLLDIDSGHWPMVSAPAQLAELLAELPQILTELREAE